MIKRKKFNTIEVNGCYYRIAALMVWDCIVAAAVFAVIANLYWYFNPVKFDLISYFKLTPFVLVVLISNIIFRTYHGSLSSPGMPLNKVAEIRGLTLSVEVSYLFMFSWLMFSRTSLEYSRMVFLISGFVTIIALPFSRFVLRWIMKKLDIFQENVIILGAGKTGRAICEEISTSCYYGYRVIGFLDDNLQRTIEKTCNPPLLGKLSDLKRVLKKHKIQHVISCLPIAMIEHLFRNNFNTVAHIIFMPSNQIFPIAWINPASIGFYAGLEMHNQHFSVIKKVTKRFLEIFFSILMLFLILPCLLLFSILIKITSPGPVLYRAKRLGLNGKKISVFKFRTMYVDADRQLERILEENPKMKSEWQSKFKLENDPRITPFGKFLRTTSLDELPQFLNVLRGEMSLIGPRPIVQDEVKRYGKMYDFLKKVRPGITGLWQVSGRSNLDYERRIMLDTYYIVNWSIWMDFYVFFKTIFIIVTKRGAY